MLDHTHPSLVSRHELLSLGVLVWTGWRTEKGRLAHAR
jgi:hypothetical protein